jgi:hypothetical protein
LKLAVTVAALVSSLVTLPAAAYCQLNLRYEGGSLKWDRIAGATDYWILESYGDPPVLRYFSTRDSSIALSHRSSVPMTVRYMVTAPIAPGVRSVGEGEPVVTNDACAGVIDVEIPADNAFRHMTRKAILPVVGSTPGAFGGRFKTSLVLRPFAASQRGRLVFHAAGQVASDSDPSIPYSFNGADPLVFDDVVAAIGQSGIGSLDIVPDDEGSSLIPIVEARLYNEASVGTFGTLAQPAYPFDYLRPPALEVVIPESDRSRVNIGFRTITETKMRILIYNAVGTLLSFRDVTYPAGWMQMTSASDFAGKALGPGQTVQVQFTGAVIPFHTVTENSTNDPTLVVVAPRPSSKNVGTYVD